MTELAALMALIIEPAVISVCAVWAILYLRRITAAAEHSAVALELMVKAGRSSGFIYDPRDDRQP